MPLLDAIGQENAFRTTPLDAASINKSLISPEDVGEFNKNRAFLKEYLSARGGRSGQ